MQQVQTVSDLAEELHDFVFSPTAYAGKSVAARATVLLERHSEAFARLVAKARELEFSLTMQKNLFEVAVRDLTEQTAILQQVADASIADLDPDTKV